MEEVEDVTFSKLELCTYRYLQQLAKSMCLPCNVKKVYLIEMIRAKKYCTNEEVNAIVARIKDERKQLTHARKSIKRKKKRIQDISTSSNGNQSPPIGMTPRRSSNSIYPSFRQSMIKYQRPSILHPTITKRTIESDRVLRSFNNRRRNYRIVNFNDSVFGVLKAHNRLEENRQYQLSMAIQSRRPIIGNCLVQRHPGNVDECVQTEDLHSMQRQRQIALHCVNRERQLVPVVKSMSIPQQKSPQRRLSGIYPLPPPEKYTELTSVGFRRQDGTIARINVLKPQERLTVLQRPPVLNIARNRTAPIVRLTRMTPNVQAHRPHQNAAPMAPKVIVQDIINYKNDHSTFSSSSTESARESSLERESAPTENANRVLAYTRKMAFTTAAEKSKRLAEFRNKAEAKRRMESRYFATENINRITEITNRNSVMPDRNTVILNLGPEYSTRRPERRDCFSYYDLNRNDSQNTTGIGNKFPENRNYDTGYSNSTTENRYYNTENINRNTEIRNHVAENAYTEERNYIIEYPNPTQNENRNYDTENNRNMETSSYVLDNINRNMENRSYDKENVYRNTENGNYDTERTNRNIENRNYETEHTNINMENRNHIAENEYRYTENKNYTIEYTNATENEHRSCVPTDENIEVNVERDYPNLSASTEVYPANQVFEVSSTEENDFSKYYHKKIRAEQVRTQRISTQASVAEGLPHITEVFSKFNDDHYRNLTQPLYVQVSEPDTVPTYPIISKAPMLESIYNIKRELLPHQPLRPVPTTDTTRCVYTTPLISTAVAHPSAVNDFNHSLAQDSSQYNIEAESTARVYDYVRIEEQERGDFRCDEVLSRSSGSFDTNCSQELGANVTIPEMVEDALELISQDGDYMERIEMDIRMQCILCDWAGPKIIMEYHIRKEHRSDVMISELTEWSAVLTLGALLARDTWLSKPVLHNGNIYVLSAKYDTDCFMAALTILPTVSDEVLKYSRITVYNKVTGEPYTWQGAIEYLPDTMPYHAACNGLKLDISRLNLLPNSANLKLVNGALVVNSAAKVVVGQPELDTIEIAVHVKIFG